MEKKVRNLAVLGRNFPIMAAVVPALLAKNILIKCEYEGHDLHIDVDRNALDNIENVGDLLAAICDGAMHWIGTDLQERAEDQGESEAKSQAAARTMNFGGLKIEIIDIGLGSQPKAPAEPPPKAAEPEAPLTPHEVLKRAVARVVADSPPNGVAAIILKRATDEAEAAGMSKREVGKLMMSELLKQLADKIIGEG